MTIIFEFLDISFKPNAALDVYFYQEFRNNFNWMEFTESTI